MKPQRLTGLDGLRGIAALAILALHVWDGHQANAFLAVDFFFMLSGYVMARSYEHRLDVPGAAGEFLLARAVRLWPPVFLASLISVPWIFLRSPSDAVWIVAANLLLLPTPSAFGLYILNPPAWSILFELLANAVHATILWRLSTRRLLGLAACLAGLLAVLAWQHGINMVDNAHLFGRGLGRLLYPYVVGILLYRIWRDSPPIKVPALLTWTAMPVFFTAGAWLWGASWLPCLLFVLVLCPLLIAGGLRSARSGLGARLATLLGEVSFPLYAIHGPLVIIMREWNTPLVVQFGVCLIAGYGFMLVMRRVSPAVARLLTPEAVRMRRMATAKA